MARGKQNKDPNVTATASEQIRRKALHALEDLHYTEEQVAEIFGVSTRTLRRWLTLYRKTGRAAPLPHGHRKSVFSAEETDRAAELLHANPAMTLRELKDALGTDASIATVCRLRQHSLGARRKRGPS